VRIEVSSEGDSGWFVSHLPRSLREIGLIHTKLVFEVLSRRENIMPVAALSHILGNELEVE
jgi:hypothetical protein